MENEPKKELLSPAPTNSSLLNSASAVISATAASPRTDLDNADVASLREMVENNR